MTIEARNAKLTIDGQELGYFGRYRPARTVEFDCYFEMSAKTLATMSRPRGFSQSHWRKVYRTMKPIDITVSA